MLIHSAVSRIVLVTYWELVDADVSCLNYAGRTALPRLSELQPVVAPQQAREGMALYLSGRSVGLDGICD